MQDYTLQELSKEQGDALTKDLQAVLEKHNAELGVKSAIELLKRVPVAEGIPSFLTKEDLDNANNSDSPTEESS